ncbi:hypothetical protein OSCT_2371 [Oscillochloris trichoides DG-6]|uniref:ArnT-like N-terminal domain-containing protein n=1 Tax=Oscillochloris trichoides DG-6 TaxID=765420 RepID=E1IGC0_9CHLR|nr:glycosyltransferase family 39 protein [Oscillochloris trichoides]EFO79773.1 hypothetical protein OSCT_2371 [Oscillochloris trichoides DG-6]
MLQTYQRPVLLILALCLWLMGCGFILSRPAVSMEQVSGLYAAEVAAGNTYRWSGDQIVIPITHHSGPTLLDIRMAAPRWPERTAPELVLATSSPLAHLIPPAEPRHYRLLLPPNAPSLTLQSSVARPPGNDPRWLGVVVYELAAQPHGLPITALYLNMLTLVLAIAAALLLDWAIRRGWATPLVLTGLAFVLRSIDLSHTPPGWRIDEVVSLVDAWNLAQTGRDHLGHPWPLGAFEALGDWIAPLLTYLELPFVALFGPQRLVGRGVTAVVGALAAPLGYALAQRLGLGRAGAITTGLMMALSPWQIFMSRIALPPALVPTFWTLTLLAAVHFIQTRERRAAIGLACAAGFALYAYPTLKMAVPLLVALALVIALAAWWVSPDRPHLGQLIRAWLPAGLLLALLWAPFISVTLFNPASSTRLGQAALRADSAIEWLRAWWAGYSVYFQPAFYYQRGDGSSIRGVPGFGAELWAGLPLLLLGLVIVIKRNVALVGARRDAPLRDTYRFIPLFILGAILIAPLPSSVTTPSPHSYRGAPIAPLYALLVGYGAAWLWQQRRPLLQYGISLVLAVGLLWQWGIWWQAYTQEYPHIQAELNQDGLAETMRRAVDMAANYDEIWISYDSIGVPYIFVLAAQPMPANESQRLIEVQRQPGRFNAISRIGRYQFVDTRTLGWDLPILAAVPGGSGSRGFVIQAWEEAGKRILVVRGM